MIHAPTADLLGDLLLQLYEAARTPSLETFQEEALRQIARVVPFDASMWGVGTVSRGQTIVKGAHVSNMSDEAVEILNREDSRNVVGKAIREQPGVAHIFSSAETFRDAGTKELWSQLGGIREVLCHGTLDAQTGLIGFLAIARQSSGESFSPADAHWIEVLAPHLEATLQICRVSELQYHNQQARAGDVGRRHTRGAVCDARGVLHVAEPGFATLLLEEWPRWQGPVLPRELAELASSPGRRELQKGQLTVVLSGVAQQRMIVVTRVSALDMLTKRERTVAESYARGLSHKEVARLLERSPATVRHHLRNIYTKLGVSDKGELARTIFEQ